MAITKVGEAQKFVYKGSVETFVAPFDGLYQLEVWGAEGGKYNVKGGAGGYSKGFIVLSKDQAVYVCIGGKGTDGYIGSESTKHAGGYNGGGSGATYVHPANKYGGAGGGGATHISTTNTILKSTVKSNLLICAGGGGGAYLNDRGGAGGGLSGEKGTGANAGQNPGTQTKAGGGDSPGGYGYGNSGVTGQSGGGGGLYGGGAGCGGSGYIGGVPDITFKGTTYTATTSNGVQTGNGKATITYLAKSSIPVALGDLELMGMAIGDKEIIGAALGDITIF